MVSRTEVNSARSGQQTQISVNRTYKHVTRFRLALSTIHVCICLVWLFRIFEQIEIRNAVHQFQVFCRDIIMYKKVTLL